MLSEANIVTIRGSRQCPPTYPTTKVLMQTMLTHRIPAVLWIQQRTQDYKLIRESAFYFESNSAKTSFTKKDPLLKDGKEPVVVVQGITIRKKVGNILPKEITFDDEFNLGDSLLMLGASHRQYPDENENSRIEDTFDNSYKEYKKKAIELKCATRGPSTIRYLPYLLRPLRKYRAYKI